MLLSKGLVLGSQTQLDELLERGLYVELGLFETHFRSVSAPPLEAIEQKFDPFLIRGSMRLSLNRLLHSLIDALANSVQLLEFAGHVQDYANKDVEAAIAACLLDRQEESRAAAHSLSCAILCSLLAKRLGWPEERQRSLVCAALTMNLGMLDLQQRLLRQATPLTPAQLEQVHAHPEAALAALTNVGVNDSIWREAVRQHHEKPGGKGYPQRLNEPAEEGQLLRLVDVFFARASARADRSPLPPAQIVRALFVEDGQGVCASLVACLVKMIGIYPPGSFVKLANGEIGVVFRNGETQKTPVVASVTNASGIPLMQPVRRDTSREAFVISGTVGSDKVSVGYDLGKLWITNAHH
ncbi:MAG: hypothetical protein H6R18_1148 [Proteobacteria bacterium]|nr:hypothetical protein [Pseudomonadota bacterium]